MSEMSDKSFKRRARRRQRATGEAYLRARREVAKLGAAAGGIPDVAREARLLSLLGLGTGGASDLSGLWAARELPVGTGESVNLDKVLRVPLGLGASGAPVWLDLKDEPAGLMIGATGSGKTAVLQSIAFGLCAQHSPDLLQLMMVSEDGRGGAWDAFVDYPHTAGVFRGADCASALMGLIDERAEALHAADAITLHYEGTSSFVDDRSVGMSRFDDVPKAVVDGLKGRTVEELMGLIETELRNRAALMPNSVQSSHGPAGSIERYNQVRSTPAGDGLPAVPYTMILVDECDLVMHQDPELVAAFDAVLRKGRQLGIGVLLASQTWGPWGDRLEANLGYRIAFRTVSEVSSRRVIGSADAYHLPVRDRGLGLLCAHPGAELVAYRSFDPVPDGRVRSVGRQLANRSSS